MRLNTIHGEGSPSVPAHVVQVFNRKVADLTSLKTLKNQTNTSKTTNSSCIRKTR